MRRRLAVACPVVLAVAAMLLQGCALTTHFAYTNTTLAWTENKAPQASFEIKRRTRQHGDVVVLLALSGGGSRAAYFSARTMFALERVPGPQGATLNVLNEVDLISAVSGGSLAAAYYAASFDAGTPGIPPGRRKWDERTVTDLISRNYIARWIGNWFWPLNIVKFWLTAFDRTDIMAQTFADNFFDSTRTGVDLRIRDLNPARPNLGLISIKRVLLSDRARATSEYERIVVVFVDAFRRSLGVSPSSADPRGLLSYVIDTNFLDATGSLLEANRQRILEDFFARTIAAYERVADCRRDNLPDHACAATWPRSVRSEVEAQLQKKLV